MAARSRDVALLISIACAPIAMSVPNALQSAHVKLTRVERDLAPPGSRTTLTATELTAYAREQADVIAPGAVSAALLSITPSGAQASANINFLRLRQAENRQDNWLMRKLLDGERPVTVRVRIQSGHGRARVDVERVEVSGIAMEGRTLEFLLRQFVIPSFPEARVGDWFALGHNIDRFTLHPGSVDVWIAGRHAGNEK